MDSSSLDPLEKLLAPSLQQMWAQLGGPCHAHPATVGSLDVGSNVVLEEWEAEFFERLLCQAWGGTFRLVESLRGGGRSHFLHLLLSRARRYGLATVATDPAAQGALLAQPLLFYQEIAQKLVTRDGRVGLPALAASRPELARAELFPEFPQWGRALELWSRDQEPLAVDFLVGRTVLREQGAPLGLHSGLSPQLALRALRCLLEFLRFAEAGPLLVACDGAGELEEGRPGLESLRHLIDICASGELPGLMVVAGVLPSFRLDVAPEYPALQQRLHHGFSPGRAGLIRPILVLEDYRAEWVGEDFATAAGERLLHMGGRLHPSLVANAGLARRNLALLLEQGRDFEDVFCCPRSVVRTIVRWLDHPDWGLGTAGGDWLSEQAARLWAEC